MKINKNIEKLIKEALKEDIGKGDITTAYLFEKNFTITAILQAKEDGILCGLDIFKCVFLSLSPAFKFKF